MTGSEQGDAERSLDEARCALLRKNFAEELVIILAESPRMEGTTIRLQDYIRGGVSVLPVFSSEQAMRLSTRGVDLKRPVWAIKRAFFCSLLRGPEIVVLDSGLESEVQTTGSELKEVFCDPA